MTYRWTKRDWLCFAVSAFASIAAGFLCIKYIPVMIDESTILNECISPITDFAPEQNEKGAYFICTLLFPVVCFLMYLITYRKQPTRLEHKGVSEKIFSAVLTIASIYIATAVVIWHSNYLVPFWSFMTKGTVWAAYGISWLAISILLFTAEPFLAGKSGAAVKKTVYIIACSAVSVYAAATYVTRTYGIDYSVAHHFDAYFSSVHKIMCGYTPTVDFTSIYGNYSYILAAVMSVMPHHGQMTFSLIIASIVALIAAVLAYVFYKTIKNKLAALIGFAASIFFIFMYPRVLDGQYVYLQYAPHRVLFPVLIVGCCVFIMNAETNKKRIIGRIFGYVLCAVALFWNLDSGVVAVAAFFAFCIYELLINYRLNEAVFWKKAVFEIIYTVAAVCASFVALIIITYIRTGVLLHLGDAVLGQTMFYGLGFYMIRMPLFHPWLMLVLVYAIAIVGAMRKISQVKSGEKPAAKADELVFVLAVTGMGIFSYYQGRSHDNCFAPIVWPSVIILTVFLDRGLGYFTKRQKKDKVGSVIVAIGCCAMALFLTAGSVGFVANAVANPFVKELTNYNRNDNGYDTKLIYRAVEDNGIYYKDVDIITYAADEIYMQFGDDDYALPVQGRADWFTWSQAQDVYDYICNSDKPYFIVDAEAYQIFVDRFGMKDDVSKIVQTISGQDLVYYLIRK